MLEYYDNDVTAMQLYDKMINFLMFLRAGRNTFFPSGPKDNLESQLLGSLSYYTRCIQIITYLHSRESFDFSI